MMELDRAGSLTPEYVEHANSYVLTLNDFLTNTIQRGYPNHHIGPIMALNGLLLIGISVAIIFEVMKLANIQIGHKQSS